MNYKHLKETYVNFNKIGFIHITKTGGTNLKDKNRNRNIIYKNDIELYEKFVNYLNNLETNDKYCNLLDL